MKGDFLFRRLSFALLLLFTVGAQASDHCGAWVWRNALSNGHDLNAIASDGNNVIVVGAYGQILMRNGGGS